MGAIRMRQQIEELIGLGESVMLDSLTEVTIHYLGPDGPTHMHVSGRSLADAVDRAFRKRAEMRSEEESPLPGEEGRGSG